MSAATDSNIEKIYIPLLDEGTEVVRPTLGVPLGGNLYLLLPTPDYDPNVEHWMFAPGSIVRGLLERRDADEVLVARELGSEN